MTADLVECPPPVSAPRVEDERLVLARARQSRARVVANLTVAAACLAIVAMGAFYLSLGAP